MRSIDAQLIEALMEEQPFRYAHLVKFEKPIKTESGKPTKVATSYSYITDASVDIRFDDGSFNAAGSPANGEQTYIANRLLDVSSISETIEARASNFSITIGAAALSTTLSASFTIAGSGPYTLTSNQNLVEAGFLEGDEIYVSGGSPGWTARIDRFITASGIPNATAYVTLIEGTITSSATNILLNTKDVGAILLDKTDSSYARYINREVYVYKAHINITNGAFIGEPFLLFKGIISSGSFSEDPTSDSKMVWNISSHWGDFIRVNGRATSDSSHRALTNDGTSDRTALIRPEYADDLGFLHSEQALNIMASYKVSETRYKMKKSGLFGLKVKMKETQVLVDREVDLRFNLEAKYLPVVYGVQRLDTIPFFVDTDKNAPNKVYAAYALCEGEIGGIFDIYFGDQSSVCLDADDSDVRSTSTEQIDVVCSGRADRGDVLTGQTTINLGSPDIAQILNMYNGLNTSGLNLFSAMPNRTFYGRDGGFTGAVAASVNPLGITHEKGRSFTDPIDCKFIVHTGTPEQRADDILVTKAQNDEFKVQGSYYTGDKSQYWGPNHRVLDTAYVTAEYILSEGEEELPSVEFVVKGKAIECYNYDYSYIHDPNATGQTAPTLGSTVLVNGVSVVVADVFTDEFSQTRVRFLTDPGTISPSFNITSPAYTLLASNAILASGTIATTLTSNASAPTLDSATQTYTVTTPASGVGLYGVNLPSLRYAIGQALATNTLTLTDEQKNQIRLIYGSSSVPTTVNGTTIAGVTNTSNAAPTVVLVKNGIKFVGTVGTNDYYNNFIVELTRASTDGSIITQRRTITDYDGTNLVATVDRDWDAVYYPKSGDTYKIYAPSDKRISNNPAIQLLDYITSVRYGRGLDVTNDINLETFKAAARKCDSRSDITIITTAMATVGDIYTYTSTTLKFRGTVLSSTLLSAGVYETTFTDVIEKLGNKWFDWKSYAVGDHIWNAGAVYQVSSAGTFATWPPTVGATLVSTSFNLTQFSGTGPGTLTVKIELSSFDGNPIVKKYVSGSRSYISGYSLYDCDDVKYWRYVGWNSQNQRHVTRHQTNVIVNTSTPVFDNINMLLGHFNGILRYNAGKYEVDVESQHSSTQASYGNNQVLTNIVSTTEWTTVSSTRTNVGVPAGPSGSDGIVVQCIESISATAVLHGIRRDISTVEDNDVIVCSAYLKQGTSYQGALRVVTKANTSAWGFFDLTNLASKTFGAAALASGIYAVGSGWYRCWVAVNVSTGGTAAKIDILLDNTYSDNTSLYIAAAATNSIYISGPKVEFYRGLDYLEGPTQLAYYPNVITEADIIGAISIEDPGNKETYNTISIDIPDPRNRFEERSVTYFNSKYLIEDNSVPKKGDMKATGITNYFNARLNAKQYLEQSRYGLKINFTMPPKGVLMIAGEIVEITNSRLGFNSKPFRITNLTVNKDCLVQISADEHTNSAYSIAASSVGAFASSESLKSGGNLPGLPTGGTATTNQNGAITLNWANPAGFNAGSDSIEIYRNIGAASTQPGSTLIAVVIGGSLTYTDTLSVSSDTFYNYWLRVKRVVYKASINSSTSLFSSGYTSTINGKSLSSLAVIYAINTTAPVIFKDAPNAATSGAHTNITVSGTRTIGTVTSPFGFVTFTGNGSSPAATGSSSILTSIGNADGKTVYTVKMYDTSPKTNELDSQDIPVIFKGATGADSIAIAYTNSSHVVPVTNTGNETWTGSGGLFYVYEGTNLLTLSSNTQSTSTPGVGSPSQYNLNISPIFGNTLTEPAITGAGTTTTTLGVWSGDLTTVTTYKITAYIRTAAGLAVTREVDVSIAPSNQGINAIVAILSKDSHVFPASPDGTVTDYTSANTEIRVFDGATALTYSPPAAGNGKWTINSTGVNITTPSPPTDSGTFVTYTYSAGVLPGTDTSSATFNITGKTSGGTSFTLSKVQSFSKSKTGTVGTPAINLTLTLPSVNITTYANGVTATSALPVGGTAKLYSGNTLLTTGVAFTSTNTGCVGSVGASSGIYSVTALSPEPNNADLVITATYASIAYVNTFTLAKNRIGYEIVNSSPTTDNFNGRMAFFNSDNKLYRYIGTSPTGFWTTAVNGGDISPGTLAATAFASNIKPVEIVSSPLPTTGLVDGRIIFLTDDKKLYRYSTAIPGWTKATDGADITASSITAGQIQAGAIGATQIAAGAITTSKLFVSSSGFNLTKDPAFSDSTAWYKIEGNGAVTFESSPSLSPPFGNTFAKVVNSAGTSPDSGAAITLGQSGGGNDRPFPITAGRRYKVSVWIRSTSASGRHYVRMYWYDSSTTLNTTSPTLTAVSPNITVSENFTLTAANTWQRLTWYWDAPTGAVSCLPRIWGAWNALASTSYFNDFRVEEYIGGELVVDGTISATKLIAETITANQISAGAITTAKIATNQITAALMQSDSITARELTISMDASPSTALSGIFMDSTANGPKIDIYDAGVLRVRLGKLS